MDDFADFVFGWVCVVISALTLLCVLKLSVWMFGVKHQPYQEQLYHLCLKESNGTAGQQCSYVLKEVKQ